MADYLELLIKTSESYRLDPTRTLYDSKEEDYVKRHGCRQGYLVAAQQEGYQWGIKELDPRYFIRILIPKIQYNPDWLLPEYDLKGNEITDKLWRFPLEKILTVGELEALKSLPYDNNIAVRPSTIAKGIERVANVVELNYWPTRPKTFKLHGSAGTFYIRPAGSTPAGDYTTLQAAHEGEDGTDLVTATAKAIFVIQDNGTAWAAAETVHFDIDNWTVDADYYVEIYAEGDAAHNGQYNTTGWISSQFIDIETNFVYMHNLQLYQEVNNPLLFSSATADNLRLTHSIFSATHTDTLSMDLQVGTGVEIENNLFFSTGATSGASTAVNVRVGAEAKVVNNTIYHHSIGIANAGTTVSKNNAIFDCGDDHSGVGSILNCATDEGAGEDDGAAGVDISGTWDSTCFTTANGTGPDWSVQDALSPLHKTGLNAGAPSDDIIGTARPQDGTTDIGCFEFIVAGGGLSIPIAMHHLQQLLR